MLIKLMMGCCDGCVGSLLNLGMLCALNRGPELGVHVRGALRNGLSEVEIREALLQVGVYVGLPAGMLDFFFSLSQSD